MNKKILIIEDEQGIADTITYSLNTEGYAAIVADTGTDGLKLLDNDEFDFVILDIGLPDISGFEVLKRIRNSSEIPVLILTARSEEIDRVLGLELGSDDYVVKPFSPRELTARVKTILRRFNKKDSENNNEKPCMMFGVDDKKRSITYCDNKLDLSRYEFEILHLFIKRPGWVFSREQIMDLIWSEPEESFERTVDAHIKSIRSKLRTINPEVDPIETHRGVGYALKEDM